ncbi:MAG TPA: hypothetical protein VMC10_19615 [Stellaceae bacterium]|nr:hypothetical protein [Stellaceae bacterium]
MRNFLRDVGGAGSGRAALETPARRVPLQAPDDDHSQAAMLRELGWTLAGCTAVIVAVNVAAALLGRH